jgi:organic hydroperoxide reductase OsmC/OhrA
MTCTIPLPNLEEEEEENRVKSKIVMASAHAACFTAG